MKTVNSLRREDPRSSAGQGLVYRWPLKLLALNLQSWLAIGPAHPPAAYLALFGVWLVGLVALPPAWYFGGERALTLAIIFNVLTQTALVLSILVQAWGVGRTLVTALGVMSFTWGVEFTGTVTGWPFGAYSYTGRLQPQLYHVPLLIPLAWLMMLPPAWAVADRVARFRRGPVFWGMSALALTAWDLFLDPQMVNWGFWIWEAQGGYFGIPWSNFGGWLLAAVLVTMLVRPGPLPARPLLLIYTVIWILQTMGQLFFWNLPGPAIAGFIGMGTCLGLVYATGRRVEE